MIRWIVLIVSYKFTVYYSLPSVSRATLDDIRIREGEGIFFLPHPTDYVQACSDFIAIL